MLYKILIYLKINLLVAALAVGCGTTPQSDQTTFALATREANLATREAALATKEADLALRENNLSVEVQATPAATPAVQALPASQNQIIPGLAVFPYDYQVRDMGDGWNVGILRLYFENTSDEPMYLSQGDLADIQVETTEGKTYPGTLDYGSYDYDYGWESYLYDQSYEKPSTFLSSRSGWYLDFHDLGFAPAHFPFSVIKESNSLLLIYEVGFRFAPAATPTKMVLSTREHGNITFDLQGDIPKSMPEPNLAEREVTSIKELTGQKMYDGENLAVILDGCTIEKEGELIDGINFHYSLLNKNNLDQLLLGTWLDFVIYTSKFQLYPVTEHIDDAINPGQSITERAYVGVPDIEDSAKMYLMYSIIDNSEPESSTTNQILYELDSCK